MMVLIAMACRLSPDAVIAYSHLLGDSVVVHVKDGRDVSGVLSSVSAEALVVEVGAAVVRVDADDLLSVESFGTHDDELGSANRELQRFSVAHELERQADTIEDGIGTTWVLVGIGAAALATTLAVAALVVASDPTRPRDEQQSIALGVGGLSVFLGGAAGVGIWSALAREEQVADLRRRADLHRSTPLVE